jgi:hypothetical protein
MTRILCLVATLFILAPARPALAGVADSPLPAIPGGIKLKHIYTVTGVTDSEDLGTVIFCTNMDKGNVFIAVEVFTSGGAGPVNDVAADNGTHLPSPGQTSTFEIPGDGVASIHEDEKIDTVVQIKSGSARILASSPKIICAATLMDKFAVPPTSMVSLPVFKKSQKGD